MVASAQKMTWMQLLYYFFLTGLGLVMVYPLIWLLFASFKSNSEIFGSIHLLPKEYVWDSFRKGWEGSGQYTFGTFFLNTFILVIPTVVFTVASSLLVAYGFARFTFPLKKLFFALMISTLFLPAVVTMIPRFMLFGQLGWLNSYYPFIVPALCGGGPFFIFLLIQFLRGLPKELDESAKMDGGHSFTILIRILLPLSKAALFSAGIFQFIWTWNDFFGQLIYINSVKKFTISLALRMSLDVAASVEWNRILAMSLAAMIPSVLLYFFAQKYFVEGIATTGLKG